MWSGDSPLLDKFRELFTLKPAWRWEKKRQMSRGIFQDPTLSLLLSAVAVGTGASVLLPLPSASAATFTRGSPRGRAVLEEPGAPHGSQPLAPNFVTGWAAVLCSRPPGHRAHQPSAVLGSAADLERTENDC